MNSPKRRRIERGSGPTDESSRPVAEILDDAQAAALVRAAQRSDDRALTRLYELFADRIFRYFFYRVGDEPRAEELTGELFIRVLESIGNYRPPREHQAQTLTGWIYRIAHNLVIDEYRRQGRRSEENLPPDELSEAVQPELSLDSHLNRVDLQQALARLTHEQQTVVLLRFQEGMTSAEIARLLGKSEFAVKAMQHRALASLARLLVLTLQGLV